MQWLQLRRDCNLATFIRLPVDALSRIQVARSQSIHSCNHCFTLWLQIRFDFASTGIRLLNKGH